MLQKEGRAYSSHDGANSRAVKLLAQPGENRPVGSFPGLCQGHEAEDRSGAGQGCPIPAEGCPRTCGPAWRRKGCKERQMQPWQRPRPSKPLASLKAQIWWEDGHVSSGLGGLAPSREPVTLREGPRRREESMIADLRNYPAIKKELPFNVVETSLATGYDQKGYGLQPQRQTILNFTRDLLPKICQAKNHDDAGMGLAGFEPATTRL